MTYRHSLTAPLVALLAGLCIVGQSEAQERREPSVMAEPAPPPTGGPAGKGAELDALFGELAASDDTAWQPIQQRIRVLWSQSPSPSMTFLLSRATEALEKQDYERAEALLDDLVRLAPDFAEGWNKRATLYFLREQYGEALADIEVTLALEPRHFGALSGLGNIMERLDRPRLAIQVYRRALELHPHLEAAQEAVERLAPIADGRKL